ncbi:MAG: glycosyltransferase family 4 protein [Aquabacterium sp.]|uniref:glycosyltransferase family 4 protein n=1 Tax=Aquabacterium sp. TaxID=1872578 RepID=UPI0025BD5E90|nr:glycosyltransferase family 1 protein [Aquabacterium sp.]MBI5926416.1 glycosyltransferase family 4 protein [Aquabacterium sp.]
MKYLYDVSELTPKAPKSIGIYRYALGLAREMSRQLLEDEQLVLVCNGSNRADFASVVSSDRTTLHCVRDAMPSHVWRQWWMLIGCALLIRRLGVDLYFSPKGFVPGALAWPRRVGRVAVIHDLIPFWYFQHRPEYFSRLETCLVGRAFRHTMRQADRIVAISNATLSALLAEGVQTSRISVVLNGVDTASIATAQPTLPAGVSGRFIFAMASSLPHKNLEGVLAGYAAYRELAGEAALPLALCGVSDVRQEGVLGLGRVSDAELDGLYQRAELFLFLSWIEGFGYPPIEALRVGTPVVCSELPVLHEVCGDMAHYAPPGQPAVVAKRMFEALASEWTSENRRVLAIAAARRIDESLAWEACASRVLNAIREVCRLSHLHRDPV